MIDPTRNVLLIGPRGCGKTTIGRGLADVLDRPFVDLDELALRLLGERSVSAVWARLGEPAWRDAEARALAGVLDGAGQVVALGGGAPTIPSVRGLIGARDRPGSAWTVYLRCPVDELTRRLRRDRGDRPALLGADAVEEIERVLAAREAIYLEVADLVIDAGGRTPEEVVGLVRAGLRRA